HAANPARQPRRAVRGFVHVRAKDAPPLCSQSLHTLFRGNDDKRLVIRREAPIHSWSGSEEAPGLDYLVDLTIVGISLGMVYGLVALGISFIYSGLDIVHFAHCEVYMIGSFLGFNMLPLTAIICPAGVML